MFKVSALAARQETSNRGASQSLLETSRERNGGKIGSKQDFCEQDCTS
jgi:hypothetical protein